MIKFETINEAGEKLASIIEKENLRFDGEAVVSSVPWASA